MDMSGNLGSYLGNGQIPH
jgi:hypothetical protein